MRWLRLVLAIVSVLIALLAAGLVSSAQQQPALLQLTTDPATDIRPAWSPDGKKIAFQSNRTGRFQIWVVDADGSNERLVGEGPGEDRHPAWSPDGKRLAFSSGTGMQREIWVMDIDGRNRRQLTSLGAFSTFPSWSPDGRQIAFYSYSNGVMDVWTVDADGNNTRRLTSGLADERRNQCTNACHVPAWSPDSQKVAFSGGDHRTVWMMDAGGGSPLQVTSGVEHEHFPWFLPDGRLAYITEHTTPQTAWTDVWAIDPATGVTQPIIQGMLLQGPVQWSPDGTKVAFHSPRSGNFDIYIADLTAAGGAEALQSVVPAATPVGRQPNAAGSPASETAVAQPSTAADMLLATALVAGASIVAVSALAYRRRRSRHGR